MLHVGWSHRAEAPARIMVYPDGCRDVIVAEPPDRAPYILFSDWDFQPRSVDVIAGTRMTGFRLRPGLTLTPGVLAELAGQETKAGACLDSMLSPTDELAYIVDLLASSTVPLARIARHAGVSSRTLQRRFRECQMPAPDSGVVSDGHDAWFPPSPPAKRWPTPQRISATAIRRT